MGYTNGEIVYLGRPQSTPYIYDTMEEFYEVVVPDSSGVQSTVAAVCGLIALALTTSDGI